MVMGIERVRELTDRALDEFEATESVAALVRQGHRISVLRHDFAAQVWFTIQQADVAGAHRNSLPADTDRLNDLRGKLIALLGEDEGSREYVRQATRWEASRTYEGTLHASSVEQVETTLAQIERTYAELNSLPPRDRDAYQAKLIPQIGGLKNVLAKIRQAVHDYLVATEEELESGRADSKFFDQVYGRINSLLSKYAPEAAVNFVAAQERVSSNDDEAISHALTSCRRMIKSLADSLYPATNEEIVGTDGVPRKMTDDAYKNRLLKFVQDNIGKHKSGAVLQAVIGDLGNRLGALDALASKGVHAKPTLEEAHTCVLQTYLLAGDLLAIAEGTSIHLRDSE
ncbi:hypothetical protein [Mycobacterium sp. 852002-40037_SCH5390672]|uniref:hypothetical protein n=1 Tax=Mycobacterium sp. 852002-40037_SCH5390672 TaxID=1834089 RepID=UPI000804D216|nr:hypothetical protein [Mycobacterium sp. 852002-40037_SCH5390672]OBB90717.1 hypothetical protein A5782_16530 [Mycobacterium sp. 852002-40037_SCH5390672]